MNVPVLETERLRLRERREADLDAFAAFCADPATARFVGATDRQVTWRRMAASIGHWHLRGFGRWAVEEKASGRWVGYAGLWSPEGWPERELIWGLAAASQGRGYATEAARHARDFAYRELGWSTLASHIDAANEGSLGVARRLGASHERDIELLGQRVGVYRHPGPGQLSNLTN
ncbi:MAG TPA: GNAT family N-acetyltransferase [Hyphomicrobiaceae bacterium]|nr:GNAT family N-acetyltransferase [Hyphomicrobiaceae bacterium]